MAKCIYPERTYEAAKYLEKNCFFFKDLEQISELFVPLLAHVTSLCGLTCHDYVITPHCYKVLWTMPKLQPYKRRVAKARSKLAKKIERRINNHSVDRGRVNEPADEGRGKKSKTRTAKPNESKRVPNSRTRNSEKASCSRQLKQVNRRTQKRLNKRVRVPGGIPKAMELLNFYLNLYVGKLRGLKGPIFKRNHKGNYDLKLITSKSDAIRAHVHFRTIGKAEGYSADNEIFGEALLAQDRIGDTTEVELERPSYLGRRAKIGHNLAISFPLVPLLQNMPIGDLNERINEGIENARNLISKKKEAEGKHGFLEENISSLPELPTPRPAAEVQEDHRPRVDFDCAEAFSEEIQLELETEQQTAEEDYKEFLRNYKEALRQWRLRNYEYPFPPGTYKMRVYHNCKVGPPPSLE